MGDVLIGYSIGILWMIGIMFLNDMHAGKTIIEHGCAEYSSTTGSFQWKDK